jgi:eukaryotic-like serine/threonine-protein kinase
MGIVYRAEHPLIGRKVAVKVLRPTFASDPEQVARFLGEAKAISSIKHRGIIDIINFGNLPDGRQYMVMEYLEGETLEQVMKREGAMSPARALGLIDEVLDALSAAHKAGVVHRDLKPANVYITLESNGARYVKLVDFGLARRASIADLRRLTGKASVMAGTPEYLSPEQVKGLSATPRTDLYCLGVLLFEMVTGRLPFKSDSVLELLNAHRVSIPPRASSLVYGLHPDIDDFIDACLRKQPEDRPSSADVARQTVQRILRQLKEETTQVKKRVSQPLALGSSEVDDPTQKARAQLLPEGPHNSSAPTAPALGMGLPRWLWPAVAGVVLAGSGVVVFAARSPRVEPTPVVVEEPTSPPPVVVPPVAVAVEVKPAQPSVPPVPVPVPAEPVVPEPPRKETPRKEPRKDTPRKQTGSKQTVRPIQGPSARKACEGAEPGWKTQLLIALGNADQSYLKQTGGKTNKTADSELKALREKIMTVKTAGDCAVVAGKLDNWQRKYIE